MQSMSDFVMGIQNISEIITDRKKTLLGFHKKIHFVMLIS